MGKIKDILNNPELLDKVAKLAFQQVDTDKSGFVTRDELAVLMTKIASDCKIATPSPAEVDNAMKAIDANGDGQISCDEFKVLVVAILTAVASQEH